MFLFLPTNFFTASSFVCLDAAEPWQFGFQSAATPIMEGIINLHNDLMAILIFLLFYVILTFMIILYFFNNCNKFSFKYLKYYGITYNTLLECI